MNRPNWLLIGAASRNVGKTEFACRLIEAHRGQTHVYAVKITTVKESGGGCPRGGDGCGVCSSLGDRKWLLTEEDCSDGNKDTQRMRRAGAAKVFWLRVQESHLAAGIAALCEQLPADAPVICESNSARRVMVPGLFLVLQQQGRTQQKASCKAVAHLADHSIWFDANNWDVSPSRIAFLGQWVLKRNASAIVLAGGASQRMGRDKSLLELDGVPLIAHITAQLAPLFDEVIISSNNAQAYAFLGLPVVADITPGMGPLMGIYSAMHHTVHDRNFVTGCDIPKMDVAFIDTLLSDEADADVVIPAGEDGRFEPLFAVYRKSALPAMKAALDKHQRRIVSFFNDVQVRSVSFAQNEGQNDWYWNLNHPEDYVRYVARNGDKPTKRERPSQNGR